MPYIVGILVGALLNVLGSAVGQVLVALGIGVATYAGLDVALGFMKTDFVGAINGLPPQLLALFGLMKIGECFSIISSAVVMKFSLNGMQNGSVKKWIKK